MSRFEQRREVNAQTILKEKKVKVPEGKKVVWLQKTGDAITETQQRYLYMAQGYGQFHADEDGTFMAIDAKEADANEKAAIEAAEAPLRSKQVRDEIGGGVQNVRSTVERQAPVSAKDFLETPDDGE